MIFVIRNFELILVTDEENILEDGKSLGLSLAMGIITSYLEEHGINVYLKDTNKISVSHKYTEKELQLLSNLYEENKVLQYLEGKDDPVLDSAVEMFLDEDDLKKDAYGISIGADFSMMQIHLGFVLGAYLKRKTKKPVFIGGNNISYLYIFKQFYKKLLSAALRGIGYVVKGPGEQIIYRMIQQLNNGEDNFKDLPGALYLKEGDIVCNKEMDPIVIRPSWGNLDLDDYSYPFMKKGRENETIYYKFPLSLTNKVIQFNKRNIRDRKLFIPYIFNYNCTYKCAFCTQSDSDRGGFIVGEVTKVVDDIEYLSKKYNSNYFYFLNNYFPSSLNYIREFRDELKRRNLKIYWSDCGRVNGLTYEKLQILYEAGCRKLVFGFESGSERILELIDKRLNLQEAVQVLKWCKEIGIWADLEIIIGLPYEHEEEFLCTYNFIKEHKDLINNFWLNEYFVVPNSLIGRYPENYGVKLLKDELDYSGLMKRNKSDFINHNYFNLTSNARLWGFDEIEPGEERNYEQMRKENQNKIARLSTLRNQEFNQLFDFYNKMVQIRKQ